MNLCKNFPTNIPGGILRIVSLGTNILDPSGMADYLKLRAKRYLEKGYIGESQINPDGTEKYDENDKRSIHICFSHEDVFLGGLRLIIRNGHPLPAEQEFALDHKVNEKACEVSRFVVVDTKELGASTVSSEIIGGAFRVIIDNDLSPYMVVERSLAVLLKRLGVKMDKVAEDAILEQYASTLNAPYLVDTPGTFALGEDGQMGDFARRNMGVWGTIINNTQQTQDLAYAT